jgi:cyanophycinase-like exopeptidase
MGARVEGCQIQTRKDASDPRFLQQLRNAASIYLCGGDPGAAREVLVDSPAADVLSSAYRAGIPLAGSSAGAMVLGTECLLPGQDFCLRPGLGLIPAVVVPHWSGAGASWRQVAERLAREHQVIAIDESTGLCWDGLAWAARGPGRAVLVTSTGEEEMGEGRPLPPVE